MRLAELDLDVAAFGHPQGVVAGRLDVGEETPHLRGRLQVVVVAVELEAIGVAHQRPGLDAQQGIVGDGVATVHVVAVVGGQEGGLEAAGDLEQLRVGAVLLGDAVILHLDEEVVAPEDVLEPPGPLQPLVEVVLHERLEHLTTEAPRGGDEPLTVIVERLPIDAGLVVVALEEGSAGQLDEVAVAGVVLGQQGQVVVELPAPFGVATGIVEPPPPGWPLGAVVVGHVGLGADDGLYALVAALPVEVQDAVHVAVVGDPEGRLPVLHRGGDQLVEARGTVEHRELGMDVQVGEGVAHDVSAADETTCLSSAALGDELAAFLQVDTGTAIGVRGSALGSHPGRQLPPTHALELLLSGHLLREQRGLDALDQPFEPPHQLGLGHLELGGAGDVLVTERQSQPGELVLEVGRQRRRQLLHRRLVDRAKSLAATFVVAGLADLGEEGLQHGAQPHDLRRVVDGLVHRLVVDRPDKRCGSIHHLGHFDVVGL